MKINRLLRIKKRKFIKITAISTTVILVLYVGISVASAIAMMEIPCQPLTNSPASVCLTYEDASFVSRNSGVVLKGWFIPAEGDSILIIVHGGSENRVDNIVDTLNLAHDLVQNGYAILLFDLEGRGESEGRGSSLFNNDLDIGGAVDYLKDRGYPISRIGIIGFCSGAASTCIFASQNNIGSIVLDGCFATVYDEVAGLAAQRTIPIFLLDFFRPGITLAVEAIYGYKMVNPIDVVAEVTCPILFIHEEYDDLITLEANNQLLRASENPASTLWEVSGARHSEAYKTHPSEYVKRVTDFFDSIMGTITH